MITDEALKKYVERRRKDLEQCLQSLEHSDFPVLENVGHKMKGNGITFGFPELSDLGAALEEAARERRFEAARSQVDRLELWLAMNARHL